jgi:hypothetical protein
VSAGDEVHLFGTLYFVRPRVVAGTGWVRQLGGTRGVPIRFPRRVIFLGEFACGEITACNRVTCGGFQSTNNLNISPLNEELEAL